MASKTLTSVADVWPVGTTVSVYVRPVSTAWSGSGTPPGSAVTTAAVASAGSVAFTGLADDTDYVAYASSRSVGFRTDPAAAAGGGGAETDTAALAALATHEGNVTDAHDLTTRLAAKAASTHSHAQSDVTGLVTSLSGKAASTHSHAESDVTNLVSDLAGKAATSHTHAESDVTGLVADLAAKGPVVQKFKTGYYYGAVGTLGTTLLAEGVMAASALPVGTTTTFDRIGVDFSAAGAAGAVVRLGIYADSSGVPGALLLDAGTVIGTAASPQEITISQQLTAGLWWLVAVTQGAAGTRPTYRALSGSQATTFPNLGALTLAAAAVTGSGGYSTAGAAASGALPGTFPTITGLGVVPRVVVRAV